MGSFNQFSTKAAQLCEATHRGFLRLVPISRIFLDATDRRIVPIVQRQMAWLNADCTGDDNLFERTFGLVCWYQLQWIVDWCHIFV